MAVLINSILVGVALLFLSVPLWNTYVFHTVNTDEIVVEGKDGLKKVSDLLSAGNFDIARDSARGLIERYRNDSLLIVPRDVLDWNRLYTLIGSGDTTILARRILCERLQEEDLKSIAACSAAVALTLPQKRLIVGALNKTIADNSFLTTYADSLIPLIEKNENPARLFKLLKSSAVVTVTGSSVTVKRTLSDVERQLLRRLGVLILTDCVFPKTIEKDLKRNTDWASEYIVQTAYYYIGICMRNDRNRTVAEANAILDTLVMLYPGSVYAELVFLDNGKVLMADGKNMLANGKVVSGKQSLHDAIGYFQKVEKNREIAREFPKYKLTELAPNTYVNVDAASRAKTKTRVETALYTQAKAKADLANTTAGETGFNLEDAVKLIGECYVALGLTDSARAQFQLLFDFFPQSDNLAATQKLIADSYVLDGNALVSGKDSSDPQKRVKADERYEIAIKQYQKFINLYSQSDLVSQVYIAIGDVYNKLRQFGAADKSFAAALNLAKETEQMAKIQLEIGNYRKERKEYPLAIKAYKVILNNFLSSKAAPNAQYLLGDCYEATGDTVGAMAAYEVIVTMYKQSIFFGNAAYKVGMWYAKRLNYTDALRCFKMGRTYDPNGAEGSRTQFQVGMVWKHTAENDSGEAVDKNYKEAIKQFSEVVKSWPGSKEADQANYQIADCNVKIGNEKAAKEAVKKIQKRDLVLNAMKLFGVAGDNAEEEVKYWQLQYKDALEDEERATALYEQAMVLSDKLKKYDEAAIAFNRVLELSKEDQKRINANVGLARIYTSQAKFADAESVYVVLFKNKKVSPELNQQLQIQMYDIFFKEKRYDTAYAEFQNYVTLYPEHPLTPYAYYRMGLVLAEQKKNQEALNTFQIILDRWTIDNSVYDKAVLGIGEQMVALGQYQQAADYLEKFVKANPGVSVAVNMYLKIIEVYNKYLNNKDKALALLEYVSANFPDDPLFSYVSYQYGMMLKEKGDEPKAVGVFEKVKKEESSLFRASQAEIGKIVAKTDPAAAIEHYRLIVAQCETPEDSTIALMGIGDVYVTVQNWDSAAAVFKGVYDNFNGRDSTLRAGALIKQIDALVNGKKYKEAIVVAELMQKSFADNPYTVNAIYFEANSYFALQNFSKAREAFQKIITLNRNEQLSEIAAYQKSECIYFAKQYPEAIREYADYLKKYPEGRYRPRALFMQGNSYWQLQEFGTAREKFAEVVAKYPQFEEICTAKNLLAFCLNKIGKWKEAVALYNEVRSKGSCAKTAITWANEQREAIISAH